MVQFGIYIMNHVYIDMHGMLYMAMHAYNTYSLFKVFSGSVAWILLEALGNGSGRCCS